MYLKISKDLKELQSKEKLELRYLLLEFSQLGKLAKRVAKLKPEPSQVQQELVKKEIKRILQKLRRGVFGSEERTVYKIARDYHQMRVIYENIFHTNSFNLQNSLGPLFYQANVYNSKIVSIGARNGLLEKILLKAAKNPIKENILEIGKLIQELTEATTSFEAIMQKLLQEGKKFKLIKSANAVIKHIEDLAVSVIDFDFDEMASIIILYNRKEYQKVLDLYNKAYHGEHKTEEEKTSSQAAFSKYERLKKYFTIDSYGLLSVKRKLSPLDLMILKKVILGYCELKNPFNKTVYLGARELCRIAAKRGFGHLLLELSLSYAAKRKSAVIPDRFQFSGAARKLWEHFDLHRNDIIKFPAAMMDHSELIGITKREIVSFYGTSTIPSTFDDMALPRGMIKKEQYIDKISDTWDLRDHHTQSYLDYEGNARTNKILGGLACLDKSYYYAGAIKTLDQLIANNEKRGGRGLLKNAANSFFHSLRKRARKVKPKLEMG